MYSVLGQLPKTLGSNMDLLMASGYKLKNTQGMAIIFIDALN